MKRLTSQAAIEIAQIIRNNQINGESLSNDSRAIEARLNEAEFQLGEGNPASIEIKARDSVHGVVQDIELSPACVEKVPFIENKVVNILALEIELRSRIEGITFDDKEEIKNFIDEVVCNLVERPAYTDAEDVNFNDGGNVYDIIDNVDELRDLQNDLINEHFE